jgi:hypothetical protein
VESVIKTAKPSKKCGIESNSAFFINIKYYVSVPKNPVYIVL